MILKSGLLHRGLGLLHVSNISNNLANMSTFNPSTSEVLTSASIVEKMNSARVPEAPKLITGDAEPIELPPQLAQIFKIITLDFAAGRAVTVIAHEAKMTTQEAADFLAVSRPTLIKLLAEFNVPYETVGRHRKIAFDAVSKLQAQLKEKQRNTISAMRKDVEAAFANAGTEGPNPMIRQ